MSREFMFMMMFFMHIIDDFFIQSHFLANGKQKGWWLDNTNDPKYENDYIPCLIMHSLSWAFCIMLPIAIYNSFNVDTLFVLVWLMNAIIHGIVDDMKANMKYLNLIQDQTIHVIQIVVTFAFAICFYNLI